MVNLMNNVFTMFVSNNNSNLYLYTHVMLKYLRFKMFKMFLRLPNDHTTNFRIMSIFFYAI